MNTIFHIGIEKLVRIKQYIGCPADDFLIR